MPPSADELRARVDAAFPAAEAALAELIGIPSVSVGPDASETALRACAERVLGLFGEVGATGRLVERPGVYPAVLAVRPGRPDLPPALLYAHYDVQPVDAGEWETEPFVAVRRGERMHGRGGSDDKAAIAVHLATLAATSPQETGTVVVFVEGEEEIGSRHAAELLADALRDQPSPQLVLVPDADAWSVEEPYLTTALRGGAQLLVTVEALERAAHSGLFGGVVPDALSATARLLASLLDEQGRPAVAGLASDVPAAVWQAPDEPQCLRDATALPSLAAIGEGSVAERLWASPAIALTGLSAVPVERATNQLLPSVQARIGVRSAPGQHPRDAAAAVTRHLHEHAPWGVRVEVELLATMRGWLGDPDAPGLRRVRACLDEAWGAPTRVIGSGTTVPLVADIAELLPDATIALTSVADARSNAHAPDESVDLSIARRLALAQALLLSG